MALEELRHIVNGPGELDYILSHSRQQGVDFSFSHLPCGEVDRVIQAGVVKSSKQFWVVDKWRELTATNPKLVKELGPYWNTIFGSDSGAAFEIEVGFLVHSTYLRFFRAFYSLKTRKGLVVFIETGVDNRTFIKT